MASMTRCSTADQTAPQSPVFKASILQLIKLYLCGRSASSHWHRVRLTALPGRQRWGRALPALHLQVDQQAVDIRRIHSPYPRRLPNVPWPDLQQTSQEQITSTIFGTTTSRNSQLQSPQLHSGRDGLNCRSESVRVILPECGWSQPPQDGTNKCSQRFWRTLASFSRASMRSVVMAA